MCTADSKSSAGQRKKRAALAKEVNQLVSDHNPTLQYQPNSAMVKKAEKLYAQLQDTYDKQLFENVPRIALVYVGMWLCQVRTFRPDQSTVIATAIEVLRLLGYGVVVDGRQVQFDHTHCLLAMPAIDAAMLYAAHGHYASDGYVLGAQFEAFAKGLYQTLYGESRGFEARYGSA